MLRLWIDTNSAFSADKLADLSERARSKGVKISIHPQVYLERRRQVRVAAGAEFSPEQFDILEQLGIDVPEIKLNQEAAERWADLLYARYPTKKAWEAAKKGTIGGQLRADFEVLPGKMPMTTDWLIALVVEEDPSSRIITRDDGEEWRALREMDPRRALTWDEAVAWLERLPDATHRVT